MSKVTAIYGEQVEIIEVEPGTILGEAITTTDLPLEQPCAGRGTCGKCKVLAEDGLAPPDSVEGENLTAGEMALGNRLACRARVQKDVQVTLAPIVVYSNKIFRASSRYKRERDIPLGLVIDLGTTTVAAMLTMLDNGEVCAGTATLNQQSAYGADVMSRLKAARDNPDDAQRLHRLALASINQAVDALNLSKRIWNRIGRVVIVGNVAMHHLLLSLPIESLTELPFQPYERQAVKDARQIMGGIFPAGVQVLLPPLIGGFVGSDALACLAAFDFDQTLEPMAAIDLGTNGEVLVTDGKRILTASTAAGPAFEGVNISCGTRAVDGAIVDVQIADGGFIFETLANEPPVGLTGTGLLSLVYELRKEGVIEESGRLAAPPPLFMERITEDSHGVRHLSLLDNDPIALSQLDVRELQKAKGAIRAAFDILLNNLSLTPEALRRVILTGSFGGQIDIDAVIALGMIPPVDRERVQALANGAGLGAALFLSDDGFSRGQTLARQAEQIDLDLDADFNMRYVESLALSPNGEA